MRLIDANKAYNVLSDYYHHRTKNQHEALKEALSKVPTIYAVPLDNYKSMEQTVYKLTKAVADAERKHGHWIYEPKDAIEMMFTLPKCSECGHESADALNYCSNCGAKMDLHEVKNG